MCSHLIAVVPMLLCVVETWAASPGSSAPTTAPGEASKTGEAFLTDVFSLREGYRQSVSLDGAWEFRRDKEGVRKDRGWHEGKDSFKDKQRNRSLVPTQHR